jgi:hypothetical protein
MTKKVNESVAFLIESELEKMQVVLAVKSIADKLQDIAKTLAKIEVDDIMPILDSMRVEFGPEVADHFNEATTSKIRETTEAIQAAKNAITTEAERLESGAPVNDMSMDSGMGDDDMASMGDETGMEDPAMAGGDDTIAPDAAMGDDMGMGGEDDLDAGFEDPAASGAAQGRARKESIAYSAKALRESSNPDQLVYQAFFAKLKESKSAATAVKAVAEAFSIDAIDVVEIVQEGNTWKDNFEKGKKDKLDKRSKDRADSKKKKEIEEGKSHKKNDEDSEDKFAKFKKRSAERDAKPKKVEETAAVKLAPHAKTAGNVAKPKVVGKVKPKASFKTGGTTGKPSSAVTKTVKEDFGMRGVPKSDATQSLSQFQVKVLDMPTVQDAKERARADYSEKRGRTIQVPYLFVLNSEQNGEQYNSRAADPFVVRIEPTDDHFLTGIWDGNVLTPRWKIVVKDGKGIVPANARIAWIDARGYRVQKKPKLGEDHNVVGILPAQLDRAIEAGDIETAKRLLNKVLTDIEKDPESRTATIAMLVKLMTNEKNKGIKEAMVDYLSNAEKRSEKAKAARAAKGFTAMDQKKK